FDSDGGPQPAPFANFRALRENLGKRGDKSYFPGNTPALIFRKRSSSYFPKMRSYFSEMFTCPGNGMSCNADGYLVPQSERRHRTFGTARVFFIKKAPVPTRESGAFCVRFGRCPHFATGFTLSGTHSMSSGAVPGGNLNRRPRFAFRLPNKSHFVSGK